jgi:hypothetical protein
VKPAFQGVLDLGLRDVGVSDQPRRIAARLECIARSRQPQFERLCGEAVRSLAFAP